MNLFNWAEYKLRYENLTTSLAYCIVLSSLATVHYKLEVESLGSLASRYDYYVLAK